MVKKQQNPTAPVASKSEVKQFLRKELSVWKASYTDLVGPEKGKVTNPQAIQAMRCLRGALALIK